MDVEDEDVEEEEEEEEEAEKEGMVCGVRYLFMYDSGGILQRTGAGSPLTFLWEVGRVNKVLFLHHHLLDVKLGGAMD